MLGTVQLGLPYGRRAGANTMRAEDAFAILDAAWELGIRAFDTAEAYGGSATRLQEWLARRSVGDQAHVVTKVNPEPNDDLDERARKALDRFLGVGDLTLLIHGWTQERVWETARAVAHDNGARAGLSVYESAEVRAARSLKGVDRMQAPGNVLNREALAARGDAPFCLDLRSVYLQGVLVEAPEEAERRVPGGGELAAAVAQASAAVGQSPVALLAGSMLLCLRGGDRLVVGVDDPGQLRPLVRAFGLDPDVVGAFQDRLRGLLPRPVDPAILDPRSWEERRRELHTT